VRKTYFKVEDNRLARELEPLTEALEAVATVETGVEDGDVRSILIECYQRDRDILKDPNELCCRC
jgi:hypothetical protein